MKKWRPLDVDRYVLARGGMFAKLVDDLNDRFGHMFPGEDEPKPEPAPEDPPDYSCPICGEDTLDSSGKCQCGVWSALAAANRRIAQLTRERDEARERGIRDALDTAEIMFLDAEWPAAAERIRNLEVK